MGPPSTRRLPFPPGHDGGITPVGGATIGGASDITGVITGGGGVPGVSGGPGGTDVVGSPGGPGRPGGMCLMLTSGPHGSGPAAYPGSGVVAMIGRWSTSHVTFRVLLDWPDNVTTFTQSRGWFHPVLRWMHTSVLGSDLWER